MWASGPRSDGQPSPGPQGSFQSGHPDSLDLFAKTLTPGFPRSPSSSQHHGSWQEGVEGLLVGPLLPASQAASHGQHGLGTLCQHVEITTHESDPERMGKDWGSSPFQWGLHPGRPCHWVRIVSSPITGRPRREGLRRRRGSEDTGTHTAFSPWLAAICHHLRGHVC